jgi:putative ABC transport system permease protein
MRRASLWLRWSWRDLRHRWPVVTAIALVIALGTGTYAALLSTSAWRTASNDASFGMLHVHDLRAALAEGTTAPEGTLAAATRSIPHAAEIEAVRERLVLPTQVAGPGGLLVPGELVGTDATPGATVDAVSVAAGRGLGASDDGQPVLVVDRGFAKANHLPPEGDLRLSGGVGANYVGQGQSPEYFLVSGGQGALPFLTQKSYGVLFATLHSAQRLSGQAGRVNDVVLTLRPGADRPLVEAELEGAFARTSPPVSATVTTRDDIGAYRVLYRDIHSDERLWRIIAALVLGGAVFAALNLTTRIVEAQRREIGIGMALGVPNRQLAIRPLLFGAEVALAGVVAGVGVGWLIGIPLRQTFIGLVPLPVWRTPFQLGVFAQAAALGFILPFAAVAWPVWRAVRVQPVDAIRVGHLTGRGGRLMAVLRQLPLPGRSYQQAPVRNLLLTPRRTILTALGVGAAITTLVTVFGFLDTFNATLDRSQHELLNAAPNRIAVTLRTFQPADGPVTADVRAIPGVAGVTPGLLIPTTITRGPDTLDTVTEVIGPLTPWTPTIVRGDASGGIVLAAKAAADLHVGVGDTVTVRHPQAAGDGYRTVDTPLRVAGIHPNPLRMLSYLDPTSASMFGLGGATNELTVVPSSGATGDSIRRALLAIPQVASAESAQTTTNGMRQSLNEYLGILQVAAAVTLLLALLIAFNTTSIGMDERRREHATMLAFGLPTRSILGLTTAEAALLGLFGTGLGIVGGHAILTWMVTTAVPSVMPDLGVTATIAAGTVTTALVLGVGTVAAAPLLTLRRLRRLDVPAALRLVE